MLINRVENAGLFWHFVDIVWIFLFPVLYLFEKPRVDMDNHAVSHAAEIDRQVRGYMVVFVALLALTAVTVGVSYLHLEVHDAVAVALVIASFKATLVRSSSCT